MLVIPATPEAEAENCLNLGGGGCSELKWHHCTPAWATEQDSISRQSKTKKLCSYGMTSEKKETRNQRLEAEKPVRRLLQAF